MSPVGVHGPLQSPPAGELLEARRVETARRLTGVAAAWSVAMGATVLAGWALDLAVVKSVVTTWVTMKPNAALAFILAGAALWSRRDEHAGQFGRWSLACAAATALIGLVTLVEHAVGWQPGIDRLLFADPANTTGTGAPGRMAPASALNFLLIGVVLWLRGDRPVARRAAQVMAVTVFGIGSMTAAGYLFQAAALYRPETSTAMAVHAALTFVVVALGLLCAQRKHGLVALLVSSTAGGSAARRLLPVAVIVPIGLGALRLAGQRSGLYRTEFGDALAALADSAVLGTMVWWTARSLFRTDLERRHNAAAVAASQQQLGQLFELSPDAVLLVHADGRIARANLQAAALFGYRAAELVGLGVERLMPARFRTAHVHARAAYENDASVRPMGQGLELLAMRRDGTEFIADIRLSPIAAGRDGSDTLCVVRDISERERVKATLELTQFAMDHASDGAAWLRQDGSVAYVNEAMCRMLGYSRDEMLAMTVFAINRRLTPEDWRLHWERLQQEHSFVIERPITTKDGRTLTLEIGVNLMVHGGRELNCASYRDVTERRRAEIGLRDAEERLRRAVTAGHIGLWDRDLATNAIFYSTEWKRQLGYDEHEISSDMSEWQSRVHPEDLPRALEAVRAHLAGNTPSYEVEFRLRHKNGTYRHILSRGAKVLDSDGRPVRLVGTHVDITERMELQAQLLQAQKMDLVGRLAGGVAHDFNNLLTVINGTADILMTESEDGSPVRADLAQIRDAGLRAAALTRQLLAFSRRQILTPAVVNLDDVVVAMRSMIQRLIGESIELVVVAPAGPCHVRVDRGQIEQALLNLVVNARDAMPDGGTLTVETGPADLDAIDAMDDPAAHAGPHAMLAVTDTGEGMDEVTQRRIFEPFFTTKPPGAGTGLGLAMVQGIVTQSGGSIRLISAPGAGTSIRIYLPRVEAATPAPVPEPALATRRGTETVLLAEDEAGVRRLASRILESAGYTVLPAASGEEALQLLARHDGPVHLLLTDLVMPGMSGRELARRITGIRPGIRVLCTSGHTNDASFRKDTGDARAHFIGKPYAPEQLTRKVREVLDSAASRPTRGSSQQPD